MKLNPAHLALAIDSPLVNPTTRNYRPPSWPPPADFPIVIDADGKVISRYGDSKWELWPWAGRPLTLNFGDGERSSSRARILSRQNAELLRRVAAWWIYGTRSTREPRTLCNRFNQLFPLFKLCTEEGISADRLSRHPSVIDRIPDLLAPSTANDAFALLHTLFEHRDMLGITLLDREGLWRLESALPSYEPRQTPYIPPRIWMYQLNRLRAFLDAFQSHQNAIEDCFTFCLTAYATNAGSLAEACRRRLIPARMPFHTPRTVTGARSGAKFHGPFSETARRFGVHDLLTRWLLRPDQSIDDPGRGVSLLGTYFNVVEQVGIAYLLNLSMMRAEEAMSLRADCLVQEHDDRFGQIFLIAGPTTKTIKDSDARWVTSPSAKIAVDTMSVVARLRMIAAEANPKVPTVESDISNPYLVLRSYEPWSNCKGVGLPLTVRPSATSYKDLVRACPSLFDEEELRITESDFNFARLITPTLDVDTFGVGKVWQLAWHQLRRTGAVNMQASGLVSDASIQYQLKHASRAMSLYYGQGYSRVRLNRKANNEYIRTMYEVLGKEVAQLFSQRFVSPHGEQRKAEILKLVNAEESKRLTAAAKAGTISWRETLLGGCTKIGPCEYGGVDNIARCGGGDGKAPCADALFDRSKAPAIRQLDQLIASRLIEAPEGSPYEESLKAQQISVRNALHAIES